jgi:hypothetical protein
VFQISPVFFANIFKKQSYATFVLRRVSKNHAVGFFLLYEKQKYWTFETKKINFL